MNLVRRNPWGNMFTLRNRMNYLFDDMFYPVVKGDEELTMCNWNPVVDIYDNDENIVIKAELPGIDKKDIAIDVKDSVLILKGERSHDSEVKEENFYRRERAFGKFERAFTLPTDVDSGKIKADFKDGVLKIDIPKPEKQKPKQITIH
jgi:HSP20 family protein